MIAITRQEMFDRAVRGLRSQGFQRAVDGGCVYQTGDGKRCAWGWVDLSLDGHEFGSVVALHKDRIGLAADLHGEDLEFARELQRSHDYSGDKALEKNLKKFGTEHNLIWPEEERPVTWTCAECRHRDHDECVRTAGGDTCACYKEGHRP